MLRCKFIRVVLRELSQADVAALAKLTQADISRIENGRLVPDERELRALARVLGGDPARLLDRVDPVHEVQ